MKKIAVIGSGSWGSALAIYLGNKGEEVTIWSFSERERDEINNNHICPLLPNVKMPENIKATNSFEEALRDAEIILHVTPSKFVRSTIKKYKEFIHNNQMIIMCSKGFEAESLKTLDEVVEEELPGIKYGILSGPSHAEEVSIGIPTAIVISSKEEVVIEKVLKVFKSNKLRMYSSKDVKGVELRWGLKKYNSILRWNISRIGIRR